MLAFQFYLQPWKQRKLGWVGTDCRFVFGQKFPGKIGSVRRCVVVMQYPVLLPTKFGAKSSHIISQSPQNFTVLCRIDCWRASKTFFLNNSLDAKNDEHALDFALHPSPFCVLFDNTQDWYRI
jgi:hypothetical protein